jgi:diguanylate cyclase (GGDEF)-like protein
MPLRVRLSITLVAIVLVPLTVTALIVLYMINQQQDRRIADQLEFAASGLNKTLQTTASRADDAAGDLVTAGAGASLAGGTVTKPNPVLLKEQVKRFAEGSGADFVAIVDKNGAVVASAVNRVPHYRLAKAAPAPLAQMATMAKDLEHNATPYALYSSVAIIKDCQTCTVGYSLAGFWLDDQTVKSVTPQHTAVTFTDANHQPTTTTLSDPEQIAAVSALSASAKGVEAGPLLVSASRVIDNKGPTAFTSVSRVAAQQNQGKTWRGLVAILAVFVAMAGMLGWLMARVTTRPLQELSDAALAVADGHLDTHIDIKSRDEVGRLALAFNTMTDELRTYIHALQDSRDELKRNLTRLGDTLSSTHDLKKMLAVILETAMVTIRAEAGALMLFSGNRDELYLKVGRGLDGRLSSASVRVAVGEGVAGRVAQTGEGVHGAVGPGSQDLRLADSEPRADSVIAVPLKSQGRVIGVLNLYDRVDADAFDDNDLATIRSFANQATVAIDNVLLHQEAQRLSITDGLTGLWNYRYFQMNFDKEIERASRFQRPLALLIFDLDKFKQVNDVYGHQRGDSVLIELATRVKGAIREVDTLARYGGEEFVLILPETDLEGATLAAGKICEIVRQRRFGAAGEEPIRVTVSVGIAVYPEHGRGGATLIKSADAALYAAKESGRDGYWVATATPEGTAAENVARSEAEGPDVLDSGLLGDDVDTGMGDAADEAATEETADAAHSGAADEAAAPADEPAPRAADEPAAPVEEPAVAPGPRADAGAA